LLQILMPYFSCATALRIVRYGWVSLRSTIPYDRINILIILYLLPASQKYCINKYSLVENY